MSLGEFKLPLRLLGLDDIPAVPVDIEGMIETLIKLDTRSKQTEQAQQGLTNLYTIQGETARGHAFLYGGLPSGHHAAKARDRLKGILRGNPLKILQLLVDRIKEEGEDLFEDIFDREPHSEDDGETSSLTQLSLDHAKQYSLGWTTLPDVYHHYKDDLESLAATLDVTQPDKATEAFWPTIAESSLMAFNLILPEKVGDTLGTWQDLFGDTWTPALDAAAQAGLLYVIDLRVYETLEHHEVKGTKTIRSANSSILSRTT